MENPIGEPVGAPKQARRKKLLSAKHKALLRKVVGNTAYYFGAVVVVCVCLSGVLLFASQQRQKKDSESDVNGTHIWIPYSSAVDNFSVDLPAYPVVDLDGYNDPHAEQIQDTYTSTFNKTDYLVARFKFFDKLPGKPEDRLNGGLMSLLDSVKGNELVSSSMCEDIDLPCLDFAITNNGDNEKGRAILLDQSDSVLLLVHAKDINDADYQRFISSFQAK